MGIRTLGFGEAISPGQSRRYIVRFPHADAFQAARAIEAPGVGVPVENERRHYVSLAAPLEPEGARLEISPLDAHLFMLEKEFGAEIIEDYQFSLERPREEAESDGRFMLRVLDEAVTVGPEVPPPPSLDDVLDLIRAREAWNTTRGAGVAIAMVDTGVNGQRPEFPAVRRAGGWAPQGDDPWQDYEGHGTMTACIAAGSRDQGGQFDGVAPEAKLLSCRTQFFDSELAAIYDFLIDRRDEDDLTIVASNSFGIRSGIPPPEHNPLFLEALDDAVAKGIVVCFSAGNYHALAGGGATDCTPNSIWTYKDRADLLTVATCDMAGVMWTYSSRGPGQHQDANGYRRKPDVTAPTPQGGRIVYGDSVKVLPDGWGTSGAAPQVSALVALLLSARPTLTRDQLFDAVRGSSVPLGHSPTCEGDGRIDCAAALAAL